MAATRHPARRALPLGAALAAALLLAPLAAPGADASDRRPAVRTQATDRPILALGDTGPSVAAWQRQINLLTQRRYVDVDGVYASSAERATMDFQRLFRLREDGVVGEHTRDVMRFMLAATRSYTHLIDYDGRSLVGYAGEASYCLEVQAGLQFSVECPAMGAGPLRGVAIAVEGREEPQLAGTASADVATVEVDTANGTVPADMFRDVPGLGRVVWSTSLPPSEVTAVRARSADGTELRRLVISDSSAYLVLERGDRGPAVTTWQEQLNSVTHAGLSNDGIFGQRVEQATLDFQRFFSLTADGIVGPETRDAMAAIQAAL